MSLLMNASVSISQGRRMSLTLEVNVQAPVNFDGDSDHIEIPADGEWHLIGYYDGNVVFDSVEVYNRALTEDEISDAFSIFGNYADRILSKDETEIIYRLLTNHPEIKSWQIRNNILYLEIDEET